MSKISVAVCSCILALVVFTCTFHIPNTGFFSSAHSTIGFISSGINNLGDTVITAIHNIFGYGEFTFLCTLSGNNGVRFGTVTIYLVPGNYYHEILSYDNRVVSSEKYPIAKAAYVSFDEKYKIATFYDSTLNELFTSKIHQDSNR